MSARLNEITFDMRVLSIQKIELSNTYISRKGNFFNTRSNNKGEKMTRLDTILVSMN